MLPESRDAARHTFESWDYPIEIDIDGEEQVTLPVQHVVNILAGVIDLADFIKQYQNHLSGGRNHPLAISARQALKIAITKP